MSRYIKSMASWKQLFLFLGMALGIFLILSLVGTVVLSGITKVPLLEIADPSQWNYSNPQLVNVLLGLQLIQFLSLFLIPCILFGYFSDPRPFAFLGLKGTNRPIYFLLGIGLMIFSFPLIQQLGVWNRNVPFPSSWGKWIGEKEDSASKVIGLILSRHSIRYLILNLIFIAAFAAFGEELFFRGVLQRIFIRMFKSPWMGILVAAFIFSAIHLQFYGFVPRFILGIFLGALYWYSGSLWTSIFAHFIYDGGLIVLAYNHPEMIKDDSTSDVTTGQMWMLAVVSCVFVVVILRVMKSISTNTYAEVYRGDFRSDDPFQQ